MRRDFSRLSLVMLGSLIVQFLLGMATNLFLVITRDPPGANRPEYFSGVAASVTWAILHGPALLRIATGGGGYSASLYFAFETA